MRRLAAVLAASLSLGAAPAPAPVAVDVLLAETPAPSLDAYRLFTDEGARHPNDRVVPYALNTPLFSDYALKSRFVFVPPGQAARYTREGAFDFPIGTTLVKTFAYPADFRAPTEKVRVLETRLLIRQKTGWVAHAYVWNAERTRAVLKRAGTRIPVSFVDAKGRAREVDYAVPNANQCKECHSLDKQISPIGPKARNLNDGHQLQRWAELGILTGLPAKPPRTAVWNDGKEPLEARARAYLDANCAHCHNPRGMASNSGLFLQEEETRAAQLGVGKRPVAAGRGSAGLEVAIKPGDPDASILVHRMASTEPGVMMPELSRSLVDEEGVALIRRWVADMKP